MSDKNTRKSRREERRLHDIQDIMENAMAGGENKLSRELTFQQAYSVYLRSRQLQVEGSAHPHLISDEERARQIDLCYEQRNR